MKKEQASDEDVAGPAEVAGISSPGEPPRVAAAGGELGFDALIPCLFL